MAISTIKTIFFKSILILLLLIHTGYSQVSGSDWLTSKWNASWIKVPETGSESYGVYLFRKNIELNSIPSTFPIYVSADNRYKLYVNENLVSIGPARGDALNWNYETIDIVSFLKPGKNIIAAQVWNEGELKPKADISVQTGFVLQGATDAAEILNTNETWNCIQDNGYSGISIKLKQYYVAGAGEMLDMNKNIKGWQKNAFDDSNWKKAKSITSALPKNKVGYGGPNGWMLVPSLLPQMELKQQRFSKLSKAEGVKVKSGFPQIKTKITIPSNSEITLLLDNSLLTNAYPKLFFSGGSNASITISYAESLYTDNSTKSNRNEIADKIFIGRSDKLISNGDKNQEFTTLTWRTFRYVQLTIITKDMPLELEDIYSTSIAYPFQLNSKFETENTEIKKMLEIGWRTARLCAVETYMDCPYYEQLQYIGDTRIQGLVSLYNSGDDRLLKNALNLIDNSRRPDGLTLSRYPTNTPQYISPFSLLYIGMLHDYMMYGKDLEFVKEKLAGARQILHYFEQFQQVDGSLKDLPWWNFTDWVETDNWKSGVRDYGKDGGSALLDTQLLLAYQTAADMEEKIGISEIAQIYHKKAAQLKTAIRNKYWDAEKNLFADRSEKDLFSQHTNTLAILTNLLTVNEKKLVAQKLLTDNSLAPASIYFKYYLHLALSNAGLGDDYVNWLDKWRENITMGLTTWAETSNLAKTRSDCHAWGSSPNIEFFRILLGIDSDDIGFSKIKIEPHLGTIKNVGGEIPHPNGGTIKVNYLLSGNELKVKINLPANTSGNFIWKGKNYTLKSGENNIKI